MVRRERMGCREGFGRRESFITEIEVMARMEKLKIEAKVFEGADADVGTSGSRGFRQRCWWSEW